MLLPTIWNLPVFFFLVKFSDSAARKRSPLETGYVTSISDDNNQHNHHMFYPHTIFTSPAKETSSILPATLLLQKSEVANQSSLPTKIYHHDLEQKKSSTHHPPPHQSPSPQHTDITHLHSPSPQLPNNAHHHIVVWLPGRVYHHAFIPPHLEHQPTATRSHLVIHDSHRNRGTIGHHGIDHLGGYGVGVDTGGQGAGHGWQVVGMLYNSFR